MGSLQAQRAIQTRWWHHSQVLQGQSNSGLSNKGCDSRREPCFLRRSANRKDDMDKTRRTTTVKQLATSTRAGKGLARVGKRLVVEPGGLELCRCSRPVRDAAPTIAPTIFCSDRLAADAGPGRRRSQLPQIRPDALEAPDFVGIGEKPARQDGQRGRRSGGGSVLGYLASWHDRGPGGRHDDGARSR